MCCFLLPCYFSLDSQWPADHIYGLTKIMHWVPDLDISVAILDIHKS